MEKNITIEEKALEVYPIEEYVSYQIDGVIDKNETKRKCFIEGAKWAIDKACNAYCKVCGHYAHKTPPHICRQDCDYYRKFKQAMEE